MREIHVLDEGYLKHRFWLSARMRSSHTGLHGIACEFILFGKIREL